MMKIQGLRIRTAVACGLVLFVVGLTGGCRTAGDAATVDEPPPVEVPRLPAASVPRAETLDESPLVVQRIIPERAEAVEEQFAFPERAPGLVQPPPEVAPYPENLFRGILDADAQVEVQLNFDAAPMTEIVPLFAALLNFSFLIDPAVQGVVTMTVESTMTAGEVWRLFEHVLWLSGAYASRNPGFIHILPFAKMPLERRLLVQHEPAANVAVLIVSIHHSASADILRVLQPFLTTGATAIDLPRLNAIMLVETPSNLPKLRALIEKLDGKGEAGWPHIALRCHEVDVEVVRQELDILLPILGLSVTAQSPAGGGEVKVVALPRLQAIVASAALPEVLAEVQRWVRLLDRQDAAEQENIYFYNVRHSTADHLAEVLEVFFVDTARRSRRVSPSSAISARAGTGAEAETRAAAPAASAARSTQASTTVPGEGNGAAASVFETPLILYADGDQNRLTVRTTRRAYAMVEALLQRLDVPPRQVLIQGVIADITLTDSLEYGFSYAAVNKFGDYLIKHAAINTTGTEVTNFPDPKVFPDGFALRLQKNEDKVAFLRAVAGASNVKVLSAPQIMATSDQEASINVGDRVPIIRGDLASISGIVGGTGTIQRNIEYVDTGVILTVTPHITAGNQVRLEIVQEVSDAVQTVTSGIDSPTIRNRKLATTLIVPDGGTALLGGLIRTRDEAGRSGIPLLMRIPVLGALFRSNEKSGQRIELLVLFTVNVIDSEDAATQLINRYRQAVETINEKLELR